MQTIETAGYPWRELSDEAKERAREWWREGKAYESFWHVCGIDEAKDVLGKIGCEVDDRRVSGFWSQGEGASLTGTYSDKKGSVKAMADELPQDNQLNRMVRERYERQRRHVYRMSASIRPNHDGQYGHERSTPIAVERDGHDLKHDDEQTCKELVVDINRWIDKWLEDEWEDQNSHETVDDNRQGHEDTVTETGKHRGYVALPPPGR